MGKKVLIIDDDPLAVKLIDNVLRDNGYQTYTADSGRKGLDILEKTIPDLITLDIQMPEEWGPRIFRKLSKKESYKNIPVLIISGLSSSKYSVPKSAGYLSKPFEKEALLAKVAEILG